MLTEGSLKGRKPGTFWDKGGAPGLGLRVEVVEHRDRKTGKARTVVNRRWIARLVVKGRLDAKGRPLRKDIGLGPAGDEAGELGLTAARDLARQYRSLARLGIDPAEARDAAIEAEAKAREDERRQREKRKTWREVVDGVRDPKTGEHVLGEDGKPVFPGFLAEMVNSHTHRSAKHRKEWASTLRETFKVTVREGVKLGDLPVAEMTAADVKAVLAPKWKPRASGGKPVAAHDLRQRMAKAWRWAKGHHLCEGECPAARDDGSRLKELLPDLPDEEENHPSMPYGDVPTFWPKLRAKGGVAARALAFLVLTGARSGSVRSLTWCEIDFGAKLWTCPAAKMKMKRDWRCPLSEAALEILRAVMPESGKPAPSALVFPGGLTARARAAGRKTPPPLSDMTLAKVLRDMTESKDIAKVPGKAGEEPRVVVPHGFRTSLRIWAAELTPYAREAAEFQLAHTLKDKVEAAYQRSDLLDIRRGLVRDWAAFVTGEQANVASLAEARAAKAGAA